MKKIYKIFLVLLLCLPTIIYAQNFEKCGSQKLMEDAFKQNPQLKIQFEQNELRLGQAISRKLQSRNSSTQSSFTSPVVIPIVFHVVLTAGQQANVTDAMILAQLSTLNNDYGGTNVDSANIPTAFQAVRGHAQISFCLAQRTPAGLATTGINRIVSSTVSSGPSSNDPIKNTASGGVDVWDPTKYVNVWLGNFSNATLLGYASFPIGSPENGVGLLSQQGVVVLAQSVNGGTAAPYNRGRTLTHELGHFFWLRHINGDASCGNDFPNTPGIDDTPQQNNLTFNCPGTAPVVGNVASGCASSPNPPGRMFQNYMDYTDDACMTMFTNGQNLRTETGINLYRLSLLTSDGCQPPVPLNGFNFGATTASTSVCPAPTNPTVNIPTTVTGTFVTPIVLTATAGVPAGATVTFAPNPLTPGATTVATLNNAGILSSGTYTITVTGTAGASVKTTTITYNITAGVGPVITAVANQTVCAPSPATFSVSTLATPVTYQWQSALTIAGTYTNIALAATSATYTTGATSAGMNGMGFRCIVSTQCGSTTSNNALLTVNTAAAITTQPTNQSACTGNTATFTGAASGLGVTYQWQSSTTGAVGSFTNIPTATNASYTTPAITAATPAFYQLVATTTTCPGTATSNVAQLIINVTAAIGTQPAAQTVCAPAPATFTVAATGSGLSYQWQMATAASPTAFTNVGTNANSYTTGATSAALNGNIYRVVVTGLCNVVTSNNATLTVNNVASITTQPTAQVVCNGTTATFTVVGAGSGTLSYQWQSGPSATGPFTNVTTGTGATTVSYTTVATTPGMNGTYYQVILNSATCPAAVTSTPVLLTVNTVAVIATQPTAQTVCKTQTATFTVVAVIVPGLTYQWQSSPSATGTFTNVTTGTGATTPSYTTPATVLADNGKFYRVNITGTCSATPTTSNAVSLTVNDPIAITAGPQLQSGCAGDNFTFSVTAVGGTFYQWQSSPTGLPGTFTNIPGANGPSLTSYTITGAPLFLNGTFFRVYGTVLCGAGISSDTSTSARLVLSNRPTIVITAPATSTNNPAVNSMIFATVSPANANVIYTWKRNGVIIPNTLGATSITLNVDDAATYEVTITDATTQCQSVSNKIITLASTSDNLIKDRIFTYPNPVRTMMQIRFNNSTASDRGTMVNMYDGKGARVFSQSYTINNTLGRMDVDMSRMQNGVYMIYLMDKNGKRLAGSKVVKLN